MKKPRFGGDGRSSREAAEREAQEELNRLTRQSGPPPSRAGDAPPPAPPPARSSYSQQRASYTSTGAVGSARSSYAPPPRPAPPARPAVSAPHESRSPGLSSGMPLPDTEAYDEDEEFEDEGEWEEDDPDEIYHGPRSAREEEEAVTGLALRDWAAGRGQVDRMEDFALPRLDAGSIEAQRDRALREIMERQERMQREYREQRAHLQPVDGGAEVSDVRAAHQMNMLRRGKPPGMMNMAAAQTGAFNRDRRERLARADTVAAEAAPAKTRAKKAAPAKAAKATTGRGVASSKAAPKAGTKAAPTRASASKAAPAKAVRAAARTPVAKTAKAPAAKAKSPVAKAAAPKFVRKAAKAAKATPPRRGSSG